MKYLFFFIGIAAAMGQAKFEPEHTEVWEPKPAKITPGINTAPPSDAIVLFDGTDLSLWEGEEGNPASWTLNDDQSLTVKPKSVGIQTKAEFGSIQLHIEWKSPEIVKGEGQGRGNSGVFFQKAYEVQVLDSYESVTYSNGQASSVYKQHIPLVNATLPPGKWQTYDIVFNEPKYEADGKRIKKGTLTVFHNGVLVQNNVEIQGKSTYRGFPKLRDINLPKKLYLQDHGDLVSYRNIWLRKL
jgi:hypothetical protein